MENSKRKQMHGILRIHNLGGMMSYLRISECLGGSKTELFVFLQENLHNRVNGWTFRSFSKGGKEAVIKLVAMVMLNHIMSFYGLPKTVP